MICPHCGNEHSDEASFCPTTGKSISSSKICPHCGESHPSSMQFCPKIGKEVAVQPLPTKPKRKSKAWIVILVLLVISLSAGGMWFIGSGAIKILFLRLTENPPSAPIEEFVEPSPTIEPSKTPMPILSPTIDQNSISTIVASTVEAQATQSALSLATTIVAHPLTTYKSYNIPLESRYIEGLSTIDINGDGRDELAVLTNERGDKQDGQLTIYEWSESEFNVIWQSNILDGYPYGLQTCDINFDGRMDILVSISGLRLIANRDNNLFDEGTIIDKTPDETFVCTDLNADKLSDLALGGPGIDGGLINIYEQSGSLKFDKRGEWMGVSGNNLVKSLLISRGESAFPGIISGELYSGDVFVYRNNSNFNFSELFKYQFNERIFGLETADFDSDGFEDFAVSKGWEKIYFFRNQDGQSFDVTYTGNSDGSFFNLLAYDLNGDSKMDLIGAEFGGKVYFYENQGDFQFRELVSQVSSASNYGLAVGDFDGDNQPDLAFGENPVKVVFNAIESFK